MSDAVGPVSPRATASPGASGRDSTGRVTRWSGWLGRRCGGRGCGAGERPLGGHPTSGHGHRPGGQALHRPRLVAGDQHGDPRCRGLGDGLVQQPAGRRVEAGVGLVEQPELGPPGGQHGEGDPAALAGRQPSGRRLGQPADQSPALEGRLDPGHVTAGGPDGETDVLPHGQVVVEVGGVGEHAHPAAHGGAVAGRVEPEDREAPRGQGHQTGTDPQQAGLSCPVGPLDENGLTHRHLEIDTGEERKPPRERDRVTE